MLLISNKAQSDIKPQLTPLVIIFLSLYHWQERLKAAEAKRIEKERTEKYNKLKTDAKDQRQKYREKYGLPESPPRSDAEEESESEDEEDGFGPSKKVEQDPMDRKLFLLLIIHID